MFYQVDQVPRGIPGQVCGSSGLRFVHLQPTAVVYQHAHIIRSTRHRLVITRHPAAQQPADQRINPFPVLPVLS